LYRQAFEVFIYIYINGGLLIFISRHHFHHAYIIKRFNVSIISNHKSLQVHSKHLLAQKKDVYKTHRVHQHLPFNECVVAMMNKYTWQVLTWKQLIKYYKDIQKVLVMKKLGF
jgi:hypothetical protein